MNQDTNNKKRSHPLRRGKACLNCRGYGYVGDVLWSWNQAFVSFESFVPQWDEGNRYKRAKQPGGRLPHLLPLWDSAEKKIQVHTFGSEPINTYLSASLGSNKLNYAKVAGSPAAGVRELIPRRITQFWETLPPIYSFYADPAMARMLVLTFAYEGSFVQKYICARVREYCAQKKPDLAAWLSGGTTTQGSNGDTIKGAVDVPTAQ
ncbi:hypothetical protein DFH07DRAFT_779404 [Mycena maculata]|uniref:Uncharacterized protein n=1 Tax=Mycena maculata TaxID=230809 RepID=A0AAD7IA27_9AGAR|nr:hypothetical protein DFH07DRAFT_779404 [Mycena maculata]